MSLLSTTTTLGNTPHSHRRPYDNDANSTTQRTPNTPSPSSSLRRTTLSPHLSFVPALLSRVLQLGEELSTETDEGHVDMNIIDDLVTRTATAVRRTLRAPIVQTEPDLYTPQALSLCAIAQFSQVSLGDVYRHYVGLTKKNTTRGNGNDQHQSHQIEEQAPGQQIDYACLKRFHNGAWKDLFPLLKVSMPLLPNSISKKKNNNNMSNDEKSTTQSFNSKRRLSSSLKPPKTPITDTMSKSHKKQKKVETPAKLFSGTHIMVIPSPLLPQSVALTLRSRAETEGAKACLLSPGAVGMAEAQKITEKLKHRDDDDTDDDDDDDGCEKKGESKCRRIVVVADIALTKRHEHKEVSQLDEVVPPKWLTDSLKAKRFKPTSLYSVTPKREEKKKKTPKQRSDVEDNDDEQMIGNGRYSAGMMSTRTADSDRSAKKRRLTIGVDTSSDFRAEANTTVGKSVGRNDDEDDDDDDDGGDGHEGNGKLDRPEVFTVATRLFATPRKKGSTGDDDEDCDDVDEDEDNGDERPITVDATTTLKKTLHASTANKAFTSTTVSLVPDGTVKQHDAVTSTAIASSPSTATKEKQTNNTNNKDINKGNTKGTATIVIGPTALTPTGKGGARWACEIRTTSRGTDYPANDRICDLLSIVQAAHEAKKDKFRSLGYQRAIARLKTLDYEILCMDDVRRLSAEPNIGGRMMTKIAEIVTTGHFRQADAVMTDATYTAMQTLCGVWGIGPVRAMQLVHVGVKDIAGLRDAVKTNQVVLDRCQLIGLNRYEDLMQRLPRTVVSELDMYVKRVVKSIDTHVDATIAGSYLRGKKSCGDVDILIHGDGPRVRKAMPLIKERMRRDGVLTDDLVEGNGKYFGVFKLPGRQYGRIDLFSVPSEQLPYALLTYTGSAVFNRSMRAKAKTLGYSLSHRGMQRVIRSSGGKTRMEASIAVENEREIFDMLDIPYVEACKRSIS